MPTFNPPPNWPRPPERWTPPTGWQPNPEWGPAPKGWQLWIPDQAEKKRSWFGRHKVLTVLGGLVALIVLLPTIGSLGSNNNSAGPGPSAQSSQGPQPPAEKTSAPPSTTSPPVSSTKPSQAAPTDSGEFGPQPSDQKSFIGDTATAQKKAEEAENDLKRGAALNTRNKALCKIVENGKVKSWTGKISSLDANSDGLGVLEIQIGDDIHVGTWNNSISDVGDDTLIKPGPLFDKLLGMDQDQVVKFSGRLMPEPTGTRVNDRRLTLSGKLSDPNYIFKFTTVGEVK